MTSIMGAYKCNLCQKIELDPRKMKSILDWESTYDGKYFEIGDPSCTIDVHICVNCMNAIIMPWCLTNGCEVYPLLGNGKENLSYKALSSICQYYWSNYNP